MWPRPLSPSKTFSKIVLLPIAAVALLLLVSYSDAGTGAATNLLADDGLADDGLADDGLAQAHNDDRLTQDLNDELLVPVEVITVGFDRRASSPIVLLRDPESGEVVPIWVGPAEAQAIARALRGVTMPRPMTHDLMANLLSEVHADVEEVLVHDLRDHVYFGTVRLRVAGEKEVRDVDSRPSDALALALRTGAPIRVVRKILVEPVKFEFVAPEGPDQVVQALGVTVVAPTPELREEFQLPDRAGVVVTHAFGPAKEEGLQRGDLIVEVNAKPLQEPVDFFQAIHATPLGGSVSITYWREGEEHELQLPSDLAPVQPRREKLVIA